MPNATLTALDQPALAVFVHLTEGLTIGNHRKLDNAQGLFMALCVERITERHYSLAHYYEQNGDLMSDPAMSFYRCEHGQVFPCSYRQDGLGIYQESLDITEAGIVEEANPQLQAQHADFANLWMRNISDQQGLPFQFPEKEER